MQIQLPKAARYAPFSSGSYRIEAGLSPLERSLGNGDIDSQVFQIDELYGQFRQNVRQARAEELGKYFVTSGFSPKMERATTKFILEQLGMEHPEYFQMSEDGSVVECVLSGETLVFDEDYRLQPDSDGDYTRALDALASQVQEDICVMHVTDGDAVLAAAHVCAPSYWDPREKIGKNFARIHEPVAGMDALNAKVPALMRAIAPGRRYQRFGWGVATDDRLNHHPEAPSAFEGTPDDWYGRVFDPDDPELHVRIERQTLIGLPEVDAVLFTIRLHFFRCGAMDAKTRAALRSALLSMSEATRKYKGIATSFEAIVHWLTEG